MIEEALVTHIKAVGLEQTMNTDQIYPVALQVDFGLPAMVYQRISTPERVESHDGPADLVTSRIQFTIYSDTYTNSREIIQALKRAVQGFKGAMGKEGLRVDRVTIEGPTDGWNADMAIFNPTVDVLISHEEV